MKNIATKFANEPDAKALHKVAVATQQSRLISCINVIDECNLYGKYISLIINSSSDGIISASERATIKTKLKQLISALAKGEKHLSQQWQEHQEGN